jgi:hypothetical protein
MLAAFVPRHDPPLGNSVFAEDLSLGETSPERHGPVEKGHPLAHHGEGVQVLLPVVHDFTGDLRSPEAAHLEVALGIGRHQSCPVQHLRRLGKDANSPES